MPAPAVFFHRLASWKAGELTWLVRLVGDLRVAVGFVSPDRGWPHVFSRLGTRGPRTSAGRQTAPGPIAGCRSGTGRGRAATRSGHPVPDLDSIPCVHRGGSAATSS